MYHNSNSDDHRYDQGNDTCSMVFLICHDYGQCLSFWGVRIGTIGDWGRIYFDTYIFVDIIIIIIIHRDDDIGDWMCQSLFDIIIDMASENV